MKNYLNIALWILVIASCAALNGKESEMPKSNVVNPNVTGSLGAFSMSLNVKDLKVSKAFYEKLGFTLKGGSLDMNYVVMKNGNSIIGLFQGMFEGNILTFNPGWDENGKELSRFVDVRQIYKDLAAKGLKFTTEIDGSASGPAFFMMEDPDGNMILVDQHR